MSTNIHTSKTILPNKCVYGLCAWMRFWMCRRNAHRPTAHTLLFRLARHIHSLSHSLNRAQFKDCYNLQPLSTCHVVIYGTWFRFANSLKKKKSVAAHSVGENMFTSTLAFKPSNVLDFGRFGYHPAITAIQLYNRIKSLFALTFFCPLLLQLLSFVFFFVYAFFFVLCVLLLCVRPNNLLSLMLYRILVGYALLLQYL